MSLLKFLWSASAKLEAETVAETTKLQGQRNTKIITLLQFIYWMSKYTAGFVWYEYMIAESIESKILCFYLIGAPFLCSGWFYITCLNPRSSLERSNILVRQFSAKMSTLSASISFSWFFYSTYSASFQGPSLKYAWSGPQEITLTWKKKRKKTLYLYPVFTVLTIFHSPTLECKIESPEVLRTLLNFLWEVHIALLTTYMVITLMVKTQHQSLVLNPDAWRVCVRV